jgi:hypothetical protein
LIPDVSEECTAFIFKGQGVLDFLDFTLILNGPFRKGKSEFHCVRSSEKDMAVVKT